MTGHHRLFTVATLAAALANGLLVSGQQSPAPPQGAQEVIATIKPNKSGALGSPVRLSPGLFTATNYPVRGLITLAYELQPFELFGAPAWADQERFDIVARFEGDTLAAANTAAWRQMLKSLLAERFQLVLRRETRTLPVYVLVRSRSDGRLGSGLRPSTRICQAGVTVPAGGRPCGGFAGSPTPRMYGDAITMAVLAKFLSSSSPQRIVVDRTGLVGTFDLDLSYDNAPQPDPDGLPSVFTALKEQLGLELRTETAPVEVTVIDRFERPTPD
jgi:uncharacterized protein (TIGR03435 family)